MLKGLAHYAQNLSSYFMLLHSKEARILFPEYSDLLCLHQSHSRRPLNLSHDVPHG